MSLFTDLSAMSRHHAEILNAAEDKASDAGQYRFEKREYFTEPEPAPTVSLYNLLDYSPAQLDHIHNVLMLGLAKLDSIKLSKSETYQDATAFARILETLMKEKTL